MIAQAGWAPTLEEYHAYPAWGASMISDFRANRRLAYAYYVARTLPPPPSTPSTRFGHLVHALIEAAANRAKVPLVVVDCEDRRRKEFKAAVAEAQPGQMVYPKGEITDALACADMILRPKTLAAQSAHNVFLRHPGHSELSLRWQHDTHLECKVRLDRICEVPGVGTVHADLKSSIDPSPEKFPRAVKSFHYLHALALRDIALGGQVTHFLVAIRNEPPYEIAVYQPQPDAMQAAHDRLRTDLTELEELLAADSEEAWAHPWESAVTPLSAEDCA